MFALTPGVGASSGWDMYTGRVHIAALLGTHQITGATSFLSFTIVFVHAWAEGEGGLWTVLWAD